MAAAAPLGPRKAPRQRRSAHTVEALLEAAAQVLELRGLEGYNTNAVARRAGASVGTLYQYFPGKDALTLALLLREDRLFHEAAAATVALPGFHAALGAFIDVAVRQQLSRPNLARLLDEQEGRPEFRAALSGKYRFHDLLAEILSKPDAPARWQDPPLCRLAADDLLALMRGMTDAAGERGERDADDLARRIGAAVFGYLAAPG
ncbi:TetR/AcrR family transcriptional regulator [Burkholderia sp. LMU1-1-1.1]|uniref:TetR/AcrR family transcriptional regulator n=1 Tax=Burkholderia sp. LMU1-1-1.1 TaxID=3135266 RepID=UPI00341378A2